MDGRLVLGLPLITYNGLLMPPVQVGTYRVSATFFGFDRNYMNASGTGTLTTIRDTTATNPRGGAGSLRRESLCRPN